MPDFLYDEVADHRARQTWGHTMLNSSRPARRHYSRGGRLALVVPTALLAITAMVTPSFADDVTPDDGGGTPAVTETPAPAPEPDPAPQPEPKPEPKPDPAPEAKPEPKPENNPAPTPGAAFADAKVIEEQAKPANDAPVQAAADD
ncbi:MAG: hypothetical protein NTX33_02700, partial [Propionibacteriales bacterium]|nr:hypothetical protein [Propionibacteriales bacterium]